MVDIRLATQQDSREMLAIYAPIITDSATSFELQVPTVDAFYHRVEQLQVRYPWLVCEWDNQIAGYAYAGPHRSREAYQWSTELSVYVSPHYYRKGIATALYQSLIAILELQGYRNTLIGISLPNHVSVSFHEKLGYTPVGIYKNVGYKFGVWHSVGWWEMPIGTLDPPQKPLLLSEVSTSEGWQEALKKGLASLEKSTGT